LRFDLSLWRHAMRVADVVRWFRPDVLHFTGPSDVGQMAALIGHKLGIPMVASWHTNVHEYASRRLLSLWTGLSESSRLRVRYSVERSTLAAALLFYSIPRVLLAPNAEWQAELERRTRKPVLVMTRGVDTSLFSPANRTRGDSTIVNVGYVGRLSVEKNVRALAHVAEGLAAAAVGNVRFTIVGDGAEREWLRSRLRNAEFTGVLRGEALARAYANFDLFVFPSETETVGNVVLEAMASGVPVVAMHRGGTKFIAASAASSMLAHNEGELVDCAVRLARDRQRRQEMGAAARAGALERAWSPVFAAVYRAYDLALAKTPLDEQPCSPSIVPLPETRSAA